MNSLRILAIAGCLALGSNAFAAHCPADMKKIDAALAAGTKLSEAEVSEVKRLRAEGEEQHKSGDHGKSVQTLGKAMQMLGIQ